MVGWGLNMWVVFGGERGGGCLVVYVGWWVFGGWRVMEGVAFLKLGIFGFCDMQRHFLWLKTSA